MPIIIQNDDGTVTDANAYVSATYVKNYFDDRGTDLSAYTDLQIEQAIVKATSYLDSRYSFRGQKITYEQSTEWPRSYAITSNGFKVTGIPPAVKKATTEYAYIALTGSLTITPTQDSSGRLLEEKEEKVGPLSTRVKYSHFDGGVYRMPTYPVPDNILKTSDLTILGTRLIRG